ncbi:phosphoserine transaminase [Solemya velum gill symbiont]|nr:phosphoserine transaminase [Solemya velum gill symbiont]OOZ01041.1 phosphoserine transaminase [Solemya velum gill symbiont]OOZ03233.1 phosphoserine transaminase [Solemya velum gill symbiont]OOZ05488.1 phosphoserine transaminase [Solemya velum gill symbiont]OOZ07725.1 phosphoserine transaminase [Solemya velum gill symbiont]
MSPVSGSVSVNNSEIHNFYAGPGKLPLSVLERIENELYDYRNTGMSIMEISHRAPPVVELLERTKEKIRRLMGLADTDAVLFLQGGGSMQFHMVPMNLSEEGDAVDYVDTGYWTTKAINAAQAMGRDVGIVARDHGAIPSDFDTRPDSKYLHICSNNTVVGTQWHDFPEVDAPLVADMSSDILSRRIDSSQFGLIYAHAQKTIGAAGVTVVIVPQATLERIPDGLPPFFDYRAHNAASSNYHTPPVFAIYVVECMLDWIEKEMGGMVALEERNKRKAELLYSCLDHSGLFNCDVEPDSRSLMNVVFDLADQALSESFSREAREAGLIGLDGHRSRGGFRASIYNAVEPDDVKSLAEFIAEFERRRG